MARAAARPGRTETYKHPEADLALRPEVGTQPQFRRKKPPVTYRYDSSLSPALDWDGENSVREQGEWLLALIEEASRLPSPHEFDGPREFRGADGKVLASCRGLHDAVAQLKRLGRPFLDWAGKAERLSFDVPTLPLFVHERLSTMAIVETLKGHTREAHDAQLGMFDMFGDPRHPIADQVLKAYEYRDKWVNRMILGDSLVVMNSLLHYEGLGGQVQMIYIDPPYGVKFGSNFQPFVRKRDVTHNDDADMTREPEMVKAYRDTWELGLHSYLTYLRDRLLLARDLLHPSGSVFVQISDENIHHVRELMDEVFGSANFIVVICYRRLGMMVGETMQSSAHYLLWYSKQRDTLKFKKNFERQVAGIGTGDHYTQIEETSSGNSRPMSPEERTNPAVIPEGSRPFQLISLTTGGFRPNTTISYEFKNRVYHPGPNKCWRTTRDGLDRLAALERLVPAGNTLRYKQYLEDFPLTEVTTIWDDTARDVENLYAVQTPSNVLRRCLLMTTDPGDLVLDPTCGSGTTAFVAAQWGRRWITVHTSRVPLALARQRLLTGTFRYYQLKDEARGPAGGFLYARRQNRRGEEDGGIVPHITLKSIANNEPPDEEILVDRPEVDDKITRVSGPFCVEATIPTPVDWDGDGGAEEGGGAEDYGSYLDRMLDVLRRAPVLQLGGGQTVTLRNVRPPAKSLALSAEAVVEGDAAMSLRDAAAAGSPPPQPSPIEGEGEKGQPSPIEGEGEKGRPSPIEGEGEKGRPSPIEGEGEKGRPSPIEGEGEKGRPSPIEGEGEKGRPSPIEGEGIRGSRGAPLPLDGGGRVGVPTADEAGQSAGRVDHIAAVLAGRSPPPQPSPIMGKGAALPVAVVFGPENGAVSERLVFEAAREAHGKGYVQLYVIGFAIQPNARRLVEECESAVGVPATYVQATPDLMMGDLLKTMRSSQIFSVCGMPDVALRKLPAAGAGEPPRYEVELLGLDVFDPVTMTPEHRDGDDVPAWLLDTDYNGLVFHGNQVFFPRTGAWEHLKKALKASHDESVWDHLAGTVSAPFEAGEHAQVAVKVIDDRGNELLVVKRLAAAE